MDALIAALMTMATFAFWRAWGRRRREPDEVVKIAIGAAIMVLAPLVLALAGYLTPAGERIPLLWAFAFHVVNEIGFAMVVPIGAGRTLLQLTLMRDLGVTVLPGIATYPLRLIEVAREERFDLASLRLRVAILGSEMWSDELRARIDRELRLTSYDIMGMTETGGPGLGIDCAARAGLHVWEDHFYPEIVDPATGRQVDTVRTTARSREAVLVESVDADVLLLQEVARTPTRSVDAWLADRLGFSRAYGRANGDLAAIGFEEGPAILSRFPLRDVGLRQLTHGHNPLVRRVALRARVTTPAGPLLVCVLGVLGLAVMTAATIRPRC